MGDAFLSPNAKQRNNKSAQKLYKSQNKWLALPGENLIIKIIWQDNKCEQNPLTHQQILVAHSWASKHIGIVTENGKSEESNSKATDSPVITHFVEILSFSR